MYSCDGRKERVVKVVVMVSGVVLMESDKAEVTVVLLVVVWQRRKW